MLKPKLLFTFPGSLGKLLPDMIVPDEMRNGRGDGLVTKESALFYKSGDAGIYPFNHAGLLFADSVKGKIIEFARKEVGP